MKKVRRELEVVTEPAKKAETLQRLHVAEVNLNYTLYYPLMRPYSALFPKNQSDSMTTRSSSAPDIEVHSTGGNEADDTEEVQGALSTNGDRVMWKAVERAMELGTLEDLRNSKPLEQGSQSGKQPQRRKKDVDLMRKQAETERGRDKLGKNVKSKARQADVGNSENDDSDGGFFE